MGSFVGYCVLVIGVILGWMVGKVLFKLICSWIWLKLVFCWKVFIILIFEKFLLLVVFVLKVVKRVFRFSFCSGV